MSRYRSQDVVFDTGTQKGRKAHKCRQDSQKKLLPKTIRYACDSVRMDEKIFMDAMRGASAARDKGEVKAESR